ncbi:hypothetical protein KNA45_000010 [Salmonella enterica]|nr:hypothetical protein [Salmonella enterica]
MSNTTDWINTISNVMIAGSAIYGAFKAKSYFKSKNDEEAYNDAKKLIFELYPQYRIDLHKLVIVLLSMTSNRIPNDILETRLEKITNRLSNTQIEIVTISSNIIERHRWKSRDDFKESFEIIKNIYRNKLSFPLINVVDEVSQSTETERQNILRELIGKCHEGIDAIHTFTDNKFRVDEYFVRPFLN